MRPLNPSDGQGWFLDESQVFETQEVVLTECGSRHRKIYHNHINGLCHHQVVASSNHCSKLVPLVFVLVCGIIGIYICV